MKAYTKDIVKTIVKGKKRFFAIMLIAALGVCMLAGLKAACDDLRYTADEFFDEQNLMDIMIVSTMGLTDTDVNVLSRLGGVEDVEGTYSETVFTYHEGKTKQVTLNVLSQKGINVPYLLEGEMPLRADEILVTRDYMSETGKQLGDTVIIEEDLGADDADDVDDSEDEDFEIEIDKEEETPNILITEYTIVGVVIDVTDINSNEGAVAFRANSTTDYTFFVLPEAIESDIYTAIYMTITGADDLLCYSDAYEERVDTIVSIIEAEIMADREQMRYDEITGEAIDKIDDAENEMNDKFSEAEDAINDAIKEIADAKQELEKGEKELAQGEKDIAKAERELEKAQRQLERAERQLDAAKEELEAAWAELEAGEEELAEGEETLKQTEEMLAQTEDILNETEEFIPQQFETMRTLIKGQITSTKSNIRTAEAEIKVLESQLEALEAEKAKLEEKAQIEELSEEEQARLDALTEEEIPDKEEELTERQEELENLEKQLSVYEASLEEIDKQEEAAYQEIAAGRAELEAGRQEVEDGKKELEDGKKQLEEARAQLEQAQAEYEAGVKEIEEGWAGLEEGWAALEEARAEIENGWEELESGKEELASGESELEANVSEYEDKKQEAQDLIDDARKEIEELKMTEWYISTRTSLSGYNNIKTDAQCIEAIGNAFPLLFLTVAILISLTTISRMVEEDRGLIGTYKALGFTDKEIRRKYVVYALLACVFGGILGDILGYVVLPKVVFVIFGVMYQLPSYVLEFNYLYGIGGILLFIVGIVGAAIVSCQTELSRMPATLMRPKAPKNGSRVFLERFPSIWGRLSFLNKVTVRNLFRYKKRLFMTLFGIAGCTSILVAGFTIKDTVTELMNKQYGSVYIYDAMVIAQDNETLLENIDDDRAIRSYLNMHISNIKVINEKGKEETVQIMVVPEGGNLRGYINLRNEDGDSLRLNDGDIYVTINVMNLLSCTKGDVISIQTLQLDMAEVEVTDIAMNYLGNCVYMTQATYEEMFGEFEGNAALIRLNTDDDKHAEWADALAEADGILSASAAAGFEEAADQVFRILNLIVYIVITLAAALAFVVLFTLATTNISERERELATIKVLGFFDPEVHAYVNKETLILTSIGIVLGLPLGKVFGEWLMSVLNMPSIYFDAHIYPISFVISVALAIIFAIIVNFITDRSLDRIDPVEALKSIE